MERESTCCFTGHRPDKLPWGGNHADARCQEMRQHLAQAVEQAYQAGFRHFICGMARGSDLYFAQAVLNLRKQFPDVTLEAARPCESQASAWPRADQQLYADILSQCNYETLVQQHYDRGCMMRRNRYMVDRSTLLIAVYNGVPQGGTAQTITYAMRQKVKLTMIEVE